MHNHSNYSTSATVFDTSSSIQFLWNQLEFGQFKPEHSTIMSSLIVLQMHVFDGITFGWISHVTVYELVGLSYISKNGLYGSTNSCLIELYEVSDLLHTLEGFSFFTFSIFHLSETSYSGSQTTSGLNSIESLSTTYFLNYSYEHINHEYSCKSSLLSNFTLNTFFNLLATTSQGKVFSLKVLSQIHCPSYDSIMLSKMSCS